MLKRVHYYCCYNISTETAQKWVYCYNISTETAQKWVYHHYYYNISTEIAHKWVYHHYYYNISTEIAHKTIKRGQSSSSSSNISTETARKRVHYYCVGCDSLAPAVDVVVEMDGENKIISPGKLLKTHSIQGDITHAEQDQSNSDGKAVSLFFFLLVLTLILFSGTVCRFSFTVWLMHFLVLLLQDLLRFDVRKCKNKCDC